MEAIGKCLAISDTVKLHESVKTVRLLKNENKCMDSFSVNMQLYAPIASMPKCNESAHPLSLWFYQAIFN